MTEDSQEQTPQAGSSPLVSVIMAVHAQADPNYFKLAAESVLEQTWSNLELVIVLDGPVPDEPIRVRDELAERDERVFTVQLPENRGPGAARNAGIARANGRYVAILDADDLAEPHRLERQIAFLENNHADLVGSDYRLVNESGETVGVKRLPVDTAAIRSRILLYNPVGNSTVLARKDVFIAHPYREDIRYGEDYSQWIRLLKAGYRILNLPEPLIAFRVPGRFLKRRRGLKPFQSDLQNKLAAVALYPLWQRPFLYPLAVVIASARLLPEPVLIPIYALGRFFTR